MSSNITLQVSRRWRRQVGVKTTATRMTRRRWRHTVTSRPVAAAKVSKHSLARRWCHRQGSWRQWPVRGPRARRVTWSRRSTFTTYCRRLQPAADQDSEDSWRHDKIHTAPRWCPRRAWLNVDDRPPALASVYWTPCRRLPAVTTTYEQQPYPPPPHISSTHVGVRRHITASWV